MHQQSVLSVCHNRYLGQSDEDVYLISGNIIRRTKGYDNYYQKNKGIITKRCVILPLTLELNKYRFTGDFVVAHR